MMHFALVGAGRIAARHAEQINRVGKLVAVADTNFVQAKALSAAFGGTAYQSLPEMLEGENSIDVVVVCSPNGFHAEHSIHALQARKHVLCEKPMCLTAAAGWQLLDTEKFTRRKLFVVKSARFNPLLQQLKAMIDSGALGRVYSFQLSCFWSRPDRYYDDWHGKEFPDGGTLYTQFSHYIDALLWLFGNLDSATGYRTNTAHQTVEFEDNGAAALVMENNIIGTLNWSVNSFRQNSEVGITVVAENGTIALGGTYMNEIRYQQLNDGLQILPATSVQENGNMQNHGHHYEVYEHLLANIGNGTSNAMDGLRTVAAIEKIYAAVGSTVFLAR